MDNVELTAKQAEYIRQATHRWNIACGAVRSGKSHLAVQYTIPMRLRERHDKRGINLILGASKENIERNVLTPMRDIWGTNMVSDINSRNWAIIFGEKVYCIGAENKRQVPKLRGSEIKYCYCDEICDIDKEVFEMLKSRLSLKYSCCDAACNPSYPSHFIKEFIDTAQKGVDIYYQHYTIYDNPFLPAEYVRSLEMEYEGTVYYGRYIQGEWTQAEGLIYPMYLKAIQEAPEEEPTKVELSIDYGTQNAFAAIRWEKHDIWYGQSEYYHSGRDTGMQKTDGEYLQDIEKWIAKDIEKYRERLKRSKEWDFMGRPPEKIKVIIDPSAASFIALLNRTDWAKVVHANNDVLNGIRDTASALQKDLIKISPSMKNWQKEAGGYVWDDDAAEDRPVKINDHLMDSMRYFVKTERIVKPVDDYKSVLI